MKDCPNCEYHKARAKRWREEAYKHAGHPLPEREWVGLTDEEMHACWDSPLTPLGMKHARMIEAKLKEKNNA